MGACVDGRARVGRRGVSRSGAKVCVSRGVGCEFEKSVAE